MKRGFFIVFEGGEGAGKSVQAKILGDRLRDAGKIVVLTREPGGTPIGEKIRSITHDPENRDLDPVAEAYLMAASRAQHVREVILPALAQGKIVISDRFADSSIAYQGYGRNLGPKEMMDLNELAVNGAKSDLVILLDVPPAVGRVRFEKERKQKDRLDMQQKDFYDRVHAGYLTLAKNNSSQYVVVDATQSVEDVASYIWKIVADLLRKRNGKE